MKGKEIPHSMEAESCLVASMVMDNTCIPKVLARVQETDFHTDHLRLMFSWVGKTYLQKKAVDLVLLKDTIPAADYERLGGAAKTMEVLEGLPNAANWESYLKTVKEKAELRKYLSLAEEVTGRIYEGQTQAKDIRDTIRRGVAYEGLLADRVSDFSGSGRQALQSIARQRLAGVDISTGWKEVDKVIGGLRRREMTVIGAKMSNGKTSVAMNLLCHSLLDTDDKKILVNAFENIEQVATRCASIISGVPLEYFVKPHLASPEEYEKVETAIKVLDEFKDRVLVMNSASLLDMRSVCDVFKPDLIIVDYLQKYAQRYCTGSTGLFAQEVGRVASEVQDLAKDFNAHSLLFSQLARRPGDQRNRPPEVPDLKESGDIENCADNIFLLWWPWRDKPDGGKDPNDYFLLIEKNKMGPCDRITLRIDVSTLSIRSYGG